MQWQVLHTLRWDLFIYEHAYSEFGICIVSTTLCTLGGARLSQKICEKDCVGKYAPEGMHMQVLYAIRKKSAYAHYTLRVDEQKLYCAYFKKNENKNKYDTLFS